MPRSTYADTDISYDLERCPECKATYLKADLPVHREALHGVPKPWVPTVLASDEDIAAARRIIGMVAQATQAQPTQESVRVSKGGVWFDTNTATGITVSWTERPGTETTHWNVQSQFRRSGWEVERRPDTKNGGFYLYCPCPSWRFGPQGPKACKHTDAVRSRALAGRV